MDDGDKETGMAEKLFMKGVMKRFKAAGRSGAQFTNALQDLGHMANWSQKAKTMYWDEKAGAVKGDADLEKASMLVREGIEVCDSVIAHFPTTISAIMPLKETLKAQLLDIEKLKEEAMKRAGSDGSV